MRPLTFHLVTLGIRVLTNADEGKPFPLITATVINCARKNKAQLLLDNGEQVYRRYEQCYFIKDALPGLNDGNLRADITERNGR